MIESIDCQTHQSCKNSIYEITMNYNSLYEQVTVIVNDTKALKTLTSDHVLVPNSSGDPLKDATLNMGYGTTVTQKSNIANLDRQGKFLRISCDRKN